MVLFLPALAGAEDLVMAPFQPSDRADCEREAISSVATSAVSWLGKPLSSRIGSTAPSELSLYQAWKASMKTVFHKELRDTSLRLMLEHLKFRKEMAGLVDIGEDRTLPLSCFSGNPDLERLAGKGQPIERSPLPSAIQLRPRERRPGSGPVGIEDPLLSYLRMANCYTGRKSPSESTSCHDLAHWAIQAVDGSDDLSNGKARSDLLIHLIATDPALAEPIFPPAGSQGPSQTALQMIVSIEKLRLADQITDVVAEERIRKIYSEANRRVLLKVKSSIWDICRDESALSLMVLNSELMDDILGRHPEYSFIYCALYNEALDRHQLAGDAREVARWLNAKAGVVSSVSGIVNWALVIGLAIGRVIPPAMPYVGTPYLAKVSIVGGLSVAAESVSAAAESLSAGDQQRRLASVWTNSEAARLANASELNHINDALEGTDREFADIFKRALGNQVLPTFLYLRSALKSLEISSKAYNAIADAPKRLPGKTPPSTPAPPFAAPPPPIQRVD